MAENYTQVNSYQDKLLEAMSIVSSQLISSIPYDKTITCTIVDDEHKAEGKYTVTNCDATFDAYSSDTKLKKEDVVYVTIPEGDYENQKIIQGKKTSGNEKPFVFTTPFDTILDLTDNLITNEATEGFVAEPKSSLIANNGYITKKEVIDQQEIETVNSWIERSKRICHLKNLNLTGYSRLGLKADFMSWIPTVSKGSYGLKITVMDNLNTTTTDDKQVTSVQQTKTLILDVSDMYGSPYNFENYYQQEKVFPITELNTITDIIIDFYQIAGSFYDIDNNILTLQDAVINTDADGLNTYTTEFGDNLFVNNVYVSLGYDVSEITDEYIVPVINDSMTYSAYRESELNKKEIDLRWVHQFDDGPKVVEAAEDFLDATARLKNCEIRWYRYRLGAAAADEYSGVYWTGLTVTPQGGYYLLSEWDGKTIEVNNTNPDGSIKVDEENNPIMKKMPDYGYKQALDNVIFSPDTSYQTEQIKAIIYLNGIAIRGPVITFRNEQSTTGNDVSNFLNALEIECVDNTLGNYLIYNEAGNILNHSDSQIERKLKCGFAETGTLAKSNLILDAEKGDTITWKIPIKNTMLSLLRCGKSNNDTFSVVALTKEDYVSNTYYIYNNSSYELSIGDFNENQVYYEKRVVSDTIKTANIWTQIKEPPEDLDKTKFELKKVLKADNKTLAYYSLCQNDIEYYRNTSALLEAPYYEPYYEPWNIYKDINANYIILQGERTLNYNLDTHITSILYPTYKIGAKYSMYNMNNTIACAIRKDRVIYTTEKEFTFGVAGTMGTDNSIVVDFVGGQTAIVVGDSSSSYQLEVKMYDENNKPKDLTNVNIAWKWYKPGGDSVSNKLSFSGNANTPVVDLINKTTVSSLGNKQEIYIAQVTVGEDDAEITTYFPIPLKRAEEYSHIDGATSVIYLSNNQPDYYKGDYQLYITNDDAIGSPDVQALPMDKITWTRITQETGTDFVANVATNGKGGLKPIAVYTAGVKNYAIVAMHEGVAVWQQPILVLRNNYPSRVINKWDGKTLTIDKEMGTILSTSIAAGKKETDNTFTGVMLGDWSSTSSDASLTKNTGVYGFHHGAMSYAFKDDGTGFIGKDAVGRIEFDGNEAVISSANYQENVRGMQIDFNGKATIDDDGDITGYNNPYIKMYGGGGKIILDTKATSTGYPFEIGNKFKAKWDGHIIANSGLIGGWQLEEVTRAVDSTTPTKGGRFIADVTAPSDYWGKIYLDPITNTISGGKLKASIFESTTSQPIKLGGSLAVYDPSKTVSIKNPHTDNMEEQVDYSTTIYDSDKNYKSGGLYGGTLGFVKQNTGSKEKDFQTAGIGFTASGGAEVKATTDNVGMSIGTNYLYLSKDTFNIHTYGKSYKFDDNGNIVPDSTDSAMSSLSFDGHGLRAETGVGRLILQTTTIGSDGPHAGIGFGSNYIALYYSRGYFRSPSSIELAPTSGNAWLTLGNIDTDSKSAKNASVQIDTNGKLTARKTLAVEACSSDANGNLITIAEKSTLAMVVNQSASVGGRLAIGQATIGTETLRVNGNAYITGATTLNYGLTVNNMQITANAGIATTSLTASGAISGGSLTITGNVSFNANAQQTGIKAQFA